MWRQSETPSRRFLGWPWSLESLGSLTSPHSLWATQLVSRSVHCGFSNRTGQNHCSRYLHFYFILHTHHFWPKRWVLVQHVLSKLFLKYTAFPFRKGQARSKLSEPPAMKESVWGRTRKHLIFQFNSQYFICSQGAINEE